MSVPLKSVDMKSLFSQKFAKEIGLEDMHWWAKSLNSSSLVMRREIAGNINLCCSFT